MIQRLKRMLRSFFGTILGAAENPERILQQNRRDMEEHIPKLKSQMAMVRANVKLVENEARRYEREVADLTSKVKAALTHGRDGVAMDLALRLESVKGHASRSKLQLETMKQAEAKTVEVHEAFIRQLEEKRQQVLEVTRAARTARWQADIADALETFTPVGIDATHDEMVRRLEEQAALDAARLDVALESVGVESTQIEEEAARIRASELIAHLKLEMGLGNGAATQSSRTKARPKSKSRASKASDASATSKTIRQSRAKSKA